MTKEELFKVPVPKNTSTYKPISHRDIYEQTVDLLDKHGISIDTEKFQTNGKGSQLITTMDIHYPGIEEIGMRIAYRNSYDKTMSIGYIAGANVWICSNGMMSGELKFTRKHTGSVVTDLKNTIVETIGQLETSFLKLVKHSDQMKTIALSTRKVSELVGRFYLEEDIITSTQLNVIKRQLEEPAYSEFSDPTLWSLYNHATFAFKEATPMNYIKQHAKLHDFIETEFELI